MQDEDLSLNEKYEFAKEHIIFVAHKISAKGIKPDPDKVKAILQVPEPMCGGRVAPQGHGELSGRVCVTAGYCHHATERPAERGKRVGLGRT